MNLEPIHIDEDQSKAIYANPYCVEIFKSYPAFYYKVGYIPPWIGYFVVEQNEVLGACGFVGKPKDGRVEIAYGTRQNRGKGSCFLSCRHLIQIARTADQGIIIWAKTAPENSFVDKYFEKE